MPEYRNDRDRAHSFDNALARPEASYDTAPAVRREPAAEARAQLDAAEQTLATIIDVSIPKLATAEPSDADRRPARERRVAYDRARETIDAEFRSVATSRQHVEAHAAQHQVDAAAMLQVFDQKVAAARASLAAAPPAPPLFERVPGEDEIVAAIAMPAGSERNTALVYLFSQLDRTRARVLGRRLEHRDPEDKLAAAFTRVVDARADLMGILDGTRKVRVDPRRVKLPPRAGAPGGGPTANGTGAPSDASPATSSKAPAPDAGPAVDPLPSNAPAPAAQAPSATREDTRVAATAGKPQLAQRGHAMQYYRLHQAAFLATARARLSAANLGTGSAQLAWAHGVARFAEELGYALTGPESSELPELLYPSEPWALIDAHRGMDDDPTSATGAMGWVPAAGFALAVAIEQSVRASLPRVAARYVAANGAPTASELVASHPMDRVIAVAFCAGGADVVVQQPSKATAPGGARPEYDVQTQGLRLVTSYTWLGERDPALWNWIHVEEPANATPEEIALTLWGRTDYAHGLTRINGYVAIPKQWARDVPGVRVRESIAGKDAEVFERSPADQLAASKLGDSVALVQGAHAAATSTDAPHPAGQPAPVAPDRAQLVDTLGSTAVILDEMRTQLAVWGLAYALDGGRAFVKRQHTTLPSATPADVAAWAPVLTAQHEIVAEAAAEMLRAMRMLGEAGASPANVSLSDRSHPGLQVLYGYASAAGTAQLGETARATLAQAKVTHATLPVSLLARASREAGRELGRLQHNAGDDRGAASRARELEVDHTELAGETAALQSQVMATGAPDPIQLETAGLDAATLGFRARVANLQVGLRALSGALDAADQGVIAAIANLPAWTRMSMTSHHLEMASFALGGVETTLDYSQPAAVNARYDAMPPSAAREFGRQFELREARKAQLVRAQQQFAEVVKKYALDGPLFEQAQQVIHDAQIRQLLTNVAVMLATGIVSGGVATLAGDFAAGVVGGGRTMTTIGEATGALRTARVVGAVTNVAVDAGINAAAQTAINGGQLGSSFVENLLTNVAIRAALHPLHAVIRTWGGLDEEAYALWTRQGARGTLALAKTAEVSAELVTSAATGYVAHRLATLARGETPDEQTIASWALQGATLTLAHLINRRLSASLARLRGAAALAGELIPRMERQQLDAQVVSDTEKIDHSVAMQLLVRHQKAIRDEVAFWRKIEADPVALRTLGLDHVQATAKLRGAEAQHADTQGQVFDFLALRFAGLEQEVAGSRLWVGSAEEIAVALANARAAQLDLEVLPPPPPEAGQIARVWQLKLNGAAIKIREHARVGRVREAIPGTEVTAASVATAKRYAAAARDLRPIVEEQTRRAVEAGPDFKTDLLQVGHGFGGVMNQNTQHEHGSAGDPHSHLILYTHDGAMTGRGALPSGQPPGSQTMPGVRTQEHTRDQTSYTQSRDLGDATEVGRLEMQTPAYRAHGTEVQELSNAPLDRGANRDPWTHADRPVRVRAENAAGPRWIYSNRAELLAGMGPTNYGPAKKVIGETDANPAAKQQMFERMRAAGVLVGGDDPDISSRFHPGDHVLVWGGSPTGAWAGEDAAMHGADTHVVSESPFVRRDANTPANVTTSDEFQLKLELERTSAEGDPARLQQLLEDRIKSTHVGASLARNQRPGATYAADAKQRGIHVEVGVPTQIRLLPSGKVEVTLGVGQAAAGVGDQPTVRVFDRVVMAVGQNPGDPGGPAGMLGAGANLGPDLQRGLPANPHAPVPEGTIALQMIRDGDGRLVGLESESGKIRLLGASYPSEKLAPWVIPRERAAFLAQVKRTATEGERTHTGQTISRDSAKVATGIEAQADRLPVAREVLAAREFALPAAVPASRLALPPDQPATWSARLEAFLTTAMRGRPGRVRVTLAATGRDGVHVFHVMNGAEDVGTVRVYDAMETAQLEAQLRAQVAARVPTLEPEAVRGTVAVAGGTTAELTSHARETGAGLRRGATLSVLVDEWAAMPDRTPEEVQARNDVFRDRIQAAVKRTAQTLADLHNQYADGGMLMSPDVKQRNIQAVYVQLASPAVTRALGAEQVARIRAKLSPLEAAFLAAKLPATAELGNAGAEALEYKDYKLDSEATTAAQKTDPEAKLMMFGKLSAADVGGIRTSLDPATQKGIGTGAADVAQFLESLHADPRLAGEVRKLEGLFSIEYNKVLTARMAPSDQAAGRTWYRVAVEVNRAGRSEPGAADRLVSLLSTEGSP